MAFQKKEENKESLARITAGSVNNMLRKNRETILKTLPRGFNFDRMCRTVINAISTTPLLAKCTPGSLFLSTIRGFSLGLEPNGPLGEGYLVPFWNKEIGGYEAQFMPGYRGLQSLARRSGEIADLYAKVVCREDEFRVEEGTARAIVHRPNYTGSRGEPVCYYAVFRLKTGEFDFEVMSLEEIERVRCSSKSATKGPWVDWPEEMAKKTVMKRLLKRAPMSVELADAALLDNRASSGDSQDDILVVEGLEVDEATPQEIQQELNQEKKADLKAALENRAQPVNIPPVQPEPEKVPASSGGLFEPSEAELDAAEAKSRK